METKIVNCLPVSGYKEELSEARKNIFLIKGKQITREDFIKRWTDHSKEFYKLAFFNSEFVLLDEMCESIEELAGRAWDRIK